MIYCLCCVASIVCVCNCFVIISLRKKELVALLWLSSCCHVAVVPCLFLTMPYVGLQYVFVAFSGHTHLLSGEFRPASEGSRTSQ